MKNQIIPASHFGLKAIETERPDRLSEIIRETEELIKDYAPEDDEEAPLWREFLIAGVQSLRMASKVWDLEVELEEMENEKH